MLFFAPAAWSFDAGVTGNGTANVFWGDLRGDDGRLDLEGEVGEGGAVRIEGIEEVEALGEDEARSFVSFEGFTGTISCGRSAM